MLIWLREGNNCVFRVCQQRSQGQCMYLAFRNFKISSKQGQQCLEAKSKVRMMFFEVKIPVMQLQLKLQRTAKITYLEGTSNKQVSA